MYIMPGFGGERCDPLSGAYHLGNGYRAYSPALMRFTCPDSASPFGAGGLNPYAYCAGDPVNRADPSGHLSWQAWMGIGAGVLGLGMALFTAGASIAAAGGVVAAIESVSPLSLVSGTVGVTADFAGVVSSTIEDQNPHASAVLGWVSLAAGALGLSVAVVGAARFASAASLDAAHGLTKTTWGGPMKVLNVEARSYVFEDVYKNAPRLNIVAHTSVVDGQRFLNIDNDLRVSPGLLANMVSGTIANLDRFEAVRLIACCGADDLENSFAAQFARLIRKPVKAFCGEVTTTSTLSTDMIHSLLNAPAEGHSLYGFSRRQRLRMFNQAGFRWTMCKVSGYSRVTFDCSGRIIGVRYGPLPPLSVQS